MCCLGTFNVHVKEPRIHEIKIRQLFFPMNQCTCTSQTTVIYNAHTGQTALRFALKGKIKTTKYNLITKLTIS